VSSTQSDQQAPQVSGRTRALISAAGILASLVVGVTSRKLSTMLDDLEDEAAHWRARAQAAEAATAPGPEAEPGDEGQAAEPAGSDG
jgi:hypothetical protein